MPNSSIDEWIYQLFKRCSRFNFLVIQVLKSGNISVWISYIIFDDIVFSKMTIMKFWYVKIEIDLLIPNI